MAGGRRRPGGGDRRPHDATAIVAGLGGRKVDGIVCTHGHNDHINAAVALAEATGAPVALHPADEMLWRAVYPERSPDMALTDGDLLDLGGAHLGRSWSDFPTILESIRTRLRTLPPETVVHTGHGDSTTIGAEAPFLDDWIARGH